MNLNAETRIGDLLDKYPFLLEFLPTVSHKYKRLTNPIIRKTIGRIATIAKAAKIGGFTTEELMGKIEGEIKRKTMQDIYNLLTDLNLGPTARLGHSLLLFLMILDEVRNPKLKYYQTPSKSQTPNSQRFS